jgi:hypothetical protein
MSFEMTGISYDSTRKTSTLQTFKSLEVNDNKQVVISPINDVAGSLASYQKDTTLPFAQIREQAWNNSVSVLKDK